MRYREDPKSGNRLSVLGFGCLRLPGALGAVDLRAAERLIVRAVEGGVNYFDTAFVYGGSEETLGKVLSRNRLRDKVYIATKLPLLRCRGPEDFDRIFAEQLTRLRTERIDYYLMHNLPHTDSWKRLCRMGIERWLERRKAEGDIGRAGFSFHGSQQEFPSLLALYPWDFCQIQYNYVNTHYQAGTEGLRRASQMGLPVMVMGPLLGGKLAEALPPSMVSLFRGVDAKRSPAAWGLRWLWDQEEVTVVLSGPREERELEENLSLADTAEPGLLTERERAVFAPVTEAFRASFKIPCTGCGYCMPCPREVNIPACFAAYNLSYAFGRMQGFKQYMTSTGMLTPGQSFGASGCVRCGACEKLCPQGIPVMRMLEAVKKRMEPFWIRLAMKPVRRMKG